MYFSSRNNFTQTKAHYKTNTAVVQGLKVHNNLFDIFYWTQSKPRSKSLVRGFRSGTGFEVSV